MKRIANLLSGARLFFLGLLGPDEMSELRMLRHNAAEIAAFCELKARADFLERENAGLMDSIRVNEELDVQRQADLARVERSLLNAQRVVNRLQKAMMQVAAAVSRTARGDEMYAEVITAMLWACNREYQGGQFYFPLGTMPPKNLWQNTSVKQAAAS